MKEHRKPLNPRNIKKFCYFIPVEAESQNEVTKLKSMLMEAEARALKDSDQLEKLKKEHESLKLEHQMKIDVIKARDERTQNTIKT